MNAPNPADTFSGNLPSLPPPPPRDNGGPLDVLHPWHPIEWTLQSRIWQDTIRAWDGRASFALEEVARQTEQDTIRKVYPERRWVEPLPPIDVTPAALPPPPLPVAPVVYRELAPEVRKREFDTLTGTAVLFAEEEPGRHRHRGPGGRFIAREA